MNEAQAAMWGIEIPEAEAPAFIPGNLETKFIEPPFSVLDSRTGRWQNRRRSWLSLGIQSEIGRGAELLFSQDSMDNLSSIYNSHGTPYSSNGMPATSIFDPVLCELAYRWWAPPGGRIFDPFAGGSVRGIVAAMLGHPYEGIDLAGDQIEANRQQALDILPADAHWPMWHHGDSRNLETILPPGQQYDMIFSCPPYFDLEVYSDDPGDLSNMEWWDFIAAYEAIIEAAAARLADSRFAVFVVSEVRDPQGLYRGLVPRTIHAFERVGLRLYNEAILVNVAGTLPLRVTKQFEAGRKLGRTHQNVLCFVKGTPPRGWSYEREAPPDPQLDLSL